MTTTDPFDTSDARLCPACEYPIHRSLVLKAQVFASIAADNPELLTEASPDTCWRCAYEVEHERAEMFAALLGKRHRLDPLEVAEAIHPTTPERGANA